MSVSSVMARVAIRPVALALAVLTLTGAHSAWEATAKQITIEVDGQSRTVRTHGSTVGDALAAAHLSPGVHDLLAPAPNAPLTAQTVIVLRRGRLMTLTVDGQVRQVWVTATSVAEALGQIGLRTDGALLSADRSREIPLKGFALQILTRKSVQILDGGKVHRVFSNGLHVGDVLREHHVHLRAADLLWPKASAPLRDGSVVKITRVDGGMRVEDDPIAYDVIRHADASMYEGDTTVVRAGQDGVLQLTFALKFVNGRLAATHLVKSVRTAAPVTEILRYGTKQRPYSVPGADNLNWWALAQCESGNDPQSVSGDGTYRGLYQFTMGAWYSVGGKGDPIDWGRDEQTYRAKLLYMARGGDGPWPSCGHYLYS